MRKIDCAHSISLTMLPWPSFREIRLCIEAKIEHVLISLQYILLFPWIREAFSSFGNARNRFLAWNYPQKYDFEGEISKSFDFRFDTHTYFPESGSRKHFQAYGMRAIDFSHDFTPNRVVFVKINFFEMRLQSTPHFKYNVIPKFPYTIFSWIKTHSNYRILMKNIFQFFTC
jgi:hypothetical protein